MFIAIGFLEKKSWVNESQLVEEIPSLWEKKNTNSDQAVEDMAHVHGEEW